MTTEATGTLSHPFTAAGMGNAPFRFTVEDEAHRELRLGGGFACCAACGHMGITRVYFVKSSDGKVSHVGSTCIDKLANADPVLVRTFADMKAKEDRKARDQKKDRDKAVVEFVLDGLSDPATREKLSAHPHPKIKGRTFLDYAEWMAKNAGLSGKLTVVKMIEKLMG